MKRKVNMASKFTVYAGLVCKEADTVSEL